MNPPIIAEHPTLINQTKKEIKENCKPKIPPPKINTQIASLVPKLPGKKDGINVTSPKRRPKYTVT